MRLLLDMNLPSAMADWLRQEAHDAVYARDIGLGTPPDRDLFAHTVAEDRILITFDLDFGDIVGAAGAAGPACCSCGCDHRAGRTCGIGWKQLSR